MNRPRWDRQNMAASEYQHMLIGYLGADLPRNEFAPSLRLIALLERLANAEERAARSAGTS